MWAGLGMVVWLSCASVPMKALELQNRGLPEPYGHTAQVSPHLPNADREWYTEYRWKKGQEYKPQDGAITTLPKHVPVPQPVVKEKRPEPSSKMLNKKPKQVSGTNATSETVKSPKAVEKKVAEPAPKAPEPVEKKVAEPAKAIKAKYPSGSPKAKKDAVEKEAPKKKAKDKAAPAKKKKPKKVWTNERYALPKPCGHTSNVHPTNSNKDREWYTEYRWQPGTEYKPQDGAITEMPQPALRGIKASPITGDPCVQVH